MESAQPSFQQKECKGVALRPPLAIQGNSHVNDSNLQARWALLKIIQDGKGVLPKKRISQILSMQWATSKHGERNSNFRYSIMGLNGLEDVPTEPAATVMGSQLVDNARV